MSRRLMRFIASILSVFLIFFCGCVGVGDNAVAPNVESTQSGGTAEESAASDTPIIPSTTTPEPMPEQIAEQNPEPTPEPIDDTIAEFAQEDAKALIETFFTDMWTPYVTLKGFTVPAYVQDNPETHLAMRWPDYTLAEIAVHPERQIISLDSIDVSIASEQKEGAVNTYPGFAEIRYLRKESSVNGVNIEFEISIDTSGETPMITAIQMVFNSNYRNMETEIRRRIEGGENAMKVIDSVVDIAIRNIT